MADVLFGVTSLMYVVATVSFVFALMGRSGALVKLGPRLVGVGAVLHAGHIVVASLVFRVCPVEGIHFPISVFSMLMGVTYATMRVRYRMDLVGALVAPLALTALMASRFVGLSGGGALPKVHSLLFPVHVTMNIIGVAFFSFAFAAAALYLVQERLLKAKKVEGLFQRLPPLDALDRAEHRFLLAGFPLLTLGIVTGTLGVHHVDMARLGDILRAVLGYVTWLLFAGVLLLRAAAGWRGRRAAYGTIAGFGCAMLVLLFYLLRGKPSTAPVVAQVLSFLGVPS
jgi:ABC-type uncharacterized transport system permease subunit